MALDVLSFLSEALLLENVSCKSLVTHSTAFRRLHPLAQSKSIPTSKAALLSAKQPSLQKNRDWYPYYAGFTEKFVRSVIAEHLSFANSILDPWSGSGTTTTVCAQRGLYSKGIDINPALTVIARARLIPRTKKLPLTNLAEEIISQANQCSTDIPPPDMLESWLDDGSLNYVRKIQTAMHNICKSELPERHDTDFKPIIDSYSSQLCFFYTSLFFSIRGILGKFRTTNPMWIKVPKSKMERINIPNDTISHAFQKAVYTLANQLTLREETKQKSESLFETGNANFLPFDTNSFDAVVTSPPYATRIDYVRGTLPELVILGSDESSIQRLREMATGSPVVRHVSANADTPLESRLANAILESIKSHPSKGSKSYYYPWMKNYLLNLQQGLREIDRIVKSNGKICLVVQDSRYKQLHLNLQQIVVDILTFLGRNLAQRYDYTAPNPRFSEVQIFEPCTVGTSSTETLLVFT